MFASGRICREAPPLAEWGWDSARADLRAADPETILRWACERFTRVGFTCSFGGTGIVLAHMIGTLMLPIPIYFLDTDYLFAETYETRKGFAERYGLRVIDVHPDMTVEEQARRYGEDLYRRDPDLCCNLRKVEPMRQVLGSLDAWISGLRRDQSAARAAVEVLERHVLEDGRDILKINPLAHWSREDAARYISENNLPQNPLADRGYKSIGCWPCTVRVGADAGERDGRWAGTGKTECGLHTFTRKADEGPGSSDT
jgi:phosphoadenosine phosphosulfate reductase